MKLWSTLAVVVALLAMPVSHATADTFTLYDKFPQTANGENNFYTAGHYNGPPETLTLLTNLADYSFSNTDGVVVERAASEPWILLTPTGTGDAVLYGTPPQACSLQVTGQFDLLPGAGTQAHVTIGTVLLTDLNTFTPIFNQDISSITSFDVTIPYLDSTHALVFAVGREGNGASLQATIDATAVPIPGTLMLLGSGLLGLPGWRRFRKS
jgi:hypothetical protein